ncbi:hypothetical protein [Candidatus Phyllobacterium onerii]|uniref:hypothetical protein n=1 Tax=Candidatus Phyllobacterium onerii TaxID=3020828 RepID=UPI00232B694A|nr:hypothetical protein [Phyllobacterium sp. IY22]
MTSPTELSNIAVSRLGGEAITDIGEGSTGARLCSLHYDIVLNSLLREHEWNFAIKRKSLALDVTAPVNGFAHRFALPDDWLKVVRINDAYTDDYRIEGLFLLCDLSVVYLEYIAKVTDPNLMDAQFVDVFAQRLAAEIAYPLTKNSTLTESAWKIYNDKIRMARTMDAKEGQPRNIEADTWLGARF